jgi:hypothetical protein
MVTMGSLLLAAPLWTGAERNWWSLGTSCMLIVVGSINLFLMWRKSPKVLSQE